MLRTNAHLLRMQVEGCPHLESILQYDGDIMYPEELLTWGCFKISVCDSEIM